MPQKTGQFGRFFFGFASVCLAAVTYNNWVLGRWLNPILFKANGSVSEFSVHGQPHYWLFRLLDITSGLLLVFAALLFVNRLGGSGFGRLVLTFMVLLGAANVADALSTLPCSETLSAQCNIPVSLSLSHYQVPAHGYSSTIIALCYLLLPLAGLGWSLRRQLWPATLISAVTVVDALVSLGLALANYANSRTLSVRTSGAGQEIQMVILGFWLVVFYFLVWQVQTNPKD